jgi:hypothetical protein
MSATDEELTTLGPQLGALLDRAEIQDLLDRYVVGIDERRFDDAWFQSIFTDDVLVEFPVGSLVWTEGDPPSDPDAGSSGVERRRPRE